MELNRLIGTIINFLTVERSETVTVSYVHIDTMKFWLNDHHLIKLTVNDEENEATLICYPTVGIEVDDVDNDQLNEIERHVQSTELLFEELNEVDFDFKISTAFVYS